MNEIQIATQGVIKCDFESIKAKVREQVEPYKSMVVTEEAVKDGKKLVASLRKDKTAYTAEVKAIKDEWLKPYNAFFEKACEVTDLYDEAIGNLTTQLDDFELKRIEEKREVIKAIYTELVPEAEFIDLIPLQRIYNKKWENATYSTKDIKEDILSKKIEAKQALEVLGSYEDSPAKEKALLNFKNGASLNECVVYMNDYFNRQREFEEQERARIQRETEERIRAEERAKIEAEQRQAQEIEKAKEEAIASLIPEQTNELKLDYTYSITLTNAEKEKLELYMNSVGIEYTEINF